MTGVVTVWRTWVSEERETNHYDPKHWPDDRSTFYEKVGRKFLSFLFCQIPVGGTANILHLLFRRVFATICADMAVDVIANRRADDHRSCLEHRLGAK